VKADKAAALGHLASELVEVTERRVAATAVGVDQDGVSLGDDIVGRPLSVKGNCDFNLIGRALAQALGEKLHAGVVLVFAWTVAGTSSNEEYLLLLGGTERGDEQEGQEEVTHKVRSLRPAGGALGSLAEDFAEVSQTAFGDVVLTGND